MMAKTYKDSKNFSTPSVNGLMKGASATTNHWGEYNK
jgi:hypothetical protein